MLEFDMKAWDRRRTANTFKEKMRAYHARQEKLVGKRAYIDFRTVRRKKAAFYAQPAWQITSDGVEIILAAWGERNTT